jgi:hypothetical protein
MHFAETSTSKHLSVYHIGRLSVIVLASVFILCHVTARAGTMGRARLTWEAAASTAVTGYRIHWGTASGVYTSSLDVGNATSVSVGDFAEGTEYYVAITAYGDAGQQSEYSDEVAFTYDSVGRMIFAEAEGGQLTAPMQAFSGGGITWVAASPKSQTASATLSFSTAISSDFYIWCRVLAPSGSQDSLYVSMDQQSEQIYHIYGEASPPASAFKSGWTWSRIDVSPGVARAFSLGAGQHAVTFRYREDTWLDRVVIVNSPTFVPTDALPRSGDFVQVVGQPQDARVVVGGAATLTSKLVATGPLTLQWYHDDLPTADSNWPVLGISNLQPADVGKYQLRAEIGTASVSTMPAMVSVISPGTFQVRNLMVSSGGRVSFVVEGAVGPEIGVYSSPDLVNWTHFATLPNNATSFSIVDPEADGSGRRFYRLSDGVAP